MSRSTIDFGIDLGTTNSAIAVLGGVAAEIIKNNDDADITPSAISIDRKGATTYVGLRAKNRVIEHYEDTYLEFKRRMGTDFVYQFKSSGQARKPEDLSAEVLKSLRADVQQRQGELIEAAVITVPAIFELHQCDATRKAAQLAGFSESPLLMEPTAASLAYGFQRESPTGYWLVYDFGGGTFDAALMKAEEGTIHMVNHGGDNFLGGSDIDWELVEKVIVPRFLAEYPLPDFTRAQSGPGHKWRQIFAKFKWQAEDVKIQLTRREKAIFEAKNLKEEGGGFACDLFECEVSRDDLIRVAEPIILRSATICERVLKEKKLAPGAVERMLLVGGPTLAPYFRDILKGRLGILLDHSVDPLTVVARGAAVFAGTQRLTSNLAGPAVAGEFTIELKYKPVGIENDPIVGGKVSGSATQDFTGFTLELTEAKTLWKSGRIALHPDGVFMANLHAEKGVRNTFTIELFDRTGTSLKVTPNTLSYTIGAVVDEQPLINSMGIALANNVYDRLLEKGRGLPLKATREYRTIVPIRRGQKGDLLRIPIVEGEHDLADRNRLIDTLTVEASATQRDLPTGCEVQVTLRIDESRIITVVAYVPLLDEEFSKKVDLRKKSPVPLVLQQDFEAEIRRFGDVMTKAAAAGGQSAAALAASPELDQLIKEVREMLAAGKGDPDAALKGEKRLLELKLKLDEAAGALEWPALVLEATQWLGHLRGVVSQHGDEGQKQHEAEIIKAVDEVKRSREPERLRKRIEEMRQLYYNILAAQPGWWIGQMQILEKGQSKMTDQARATRLIAQGRECVEKNNLLGLQTVVRQLWDLLPQGEAEAARRGYQSGVVR